MYPKVPSSTKSLCLSNKVPSKTNVVPTESNVIFLIPGKNSVIILAEIMLVLEETYFLNEYYPFFPVLQLEVLNFIELETTYDRFKVVMIK